MKLELKKVTTCVLVAAFFALASSMSFDDEVNQDVRYCQMVADGNWGAYKDNVNCDEVTIQNN